MKDKWRPKNVPNTICKDFFFFLFLTLYLNNFNKNNFIQLIFYLAQISKILHEYKKMSKNVLILWILNITILALNVSSLSSSIHPDNIHPNAIVYNTIYDIWTKILETVSNIKTIIFNASHVYFIFIYSIFFSFF